LIIEHLLQTSFISLKGFYFLEKPANKHAKKCGSRLPNLRLGAPRTNKQNCTSCSAYSITDSTKRQLLQLVGKTCTKTINIAHCKINISEHSYSTNEQMWK